jgi:ATP-binding cassette, subfamily B, bacterial
MSRSSTDRDAALTGVQAFRLGLRVARCHPWWYLACAVMWTTWWTLPVGVGLVLQAVFNALAGPSPAGLGVPSLLVALLAVEFGRIGLLYPAVMVIVRWWVEMMTLLRHNLLRAQLANGGNEAGAPVTDAGAAIPSFRDDIEDVLMFVDGWLDVAGTALFAVTALAVMARVDLLITLVVVVPFGCVFLVNRALAERIRRTRRADREATAEVTGFLGSVFAAVLALKVAGAQDRAVAELRRRNGRRSRTALRDRLLNDSLDAFSASTVDLSVGLVLLLVAGAMRDGTFTVGDLALFASYLGSLSSLPRWLGLLLARHRHAQVGFTRMGALLPARDPARLTVRRDLQLAPPRPAAPRPRPSRPAPADVHLEGFGGGIVTGVDLHLQPGSFTVVCGPVGSGKTTLLRAVLGLTGRTAGTLRWNGAPVADLARHMVPPRCAYVPQVPRLFTGTLRENLTVGLDTAADVLDRAVWRAAFDADVEEMPDGLDTLVGPRGVRLSGGQLQRAAAARALVADPSLLVLDDLSSVLDADTERMVWSRMREGTDATWLVVSHRAAALERADRIVLLDAGRVTAVGTLAELRGRGLDPLGAMADGPDPRGATTDGPDPRGATTDGPDPRGATTDAAR